MSKPRIRDKRGTKPGASVDPSSPLPSDLWIYLLLAVAVLTVYGQVLHFDFVTYDDPDYVTANPHVQAGLTWAGFAWAFRTSFAGNWFPLTWLSHMLDVSLFGLDSGWHHFTNTWLHALSTLLWFALLKRLTGSRWRSALVAFLFALHPLHVESVAWVAERKDVLSGLFWVLTLWAYAGYADRPAPLRYALTLLLFCLGLMAKPMLVTLPVVLLLLDRWPLQRGTKILEKIPVLCCLSRRLAGDRLRAQRSRRHRLALPHSAGSAFRKLADLLRCVLPPNAVARRFGRILSLSDGIAPPAGGPRRHRVSRRHAVCRPRLSASSRTSPSAGSGT